MKTVLFGVYPDKIQVQQTYMAGDFISVHVLAPASPGPGYNKKWNTERVGWRTILTSEES